MRVPINGIELEVEVLGVEGAPTIIALHGAPGLSSRAEPKASFGALADEYRVIVFDGRGSGESSYDEPYTHDQWTADIDALRVWAGVERIIIAGGSYGGFLSLEYATRYAEHVSAIVLRSTALDNAFVASARENASKSTRVKIDMELYDKIFDGRLQSNEEFREGYKMIAPLYPYKYDASALPEAEDRRLDQIRFNYRAQNFAFAHNMPQYDVSKALQEVKRPTLITAGRHDWIVPIEESQRIAEAIAGSELVVFENSGHSPQVEEKDAWVAVVRGFLRKNI